VWLAVLCVLVLVLTVAGLVDQVRYDRGHRRRPRAHRRPR
jgi:hypothetical protein